MSEKAFEIDPSETLSFDRIVILPSHHCSDLVLIDPACADAVAYVSIGAGETHVTVLDSEGTDIKSWTAVIGWSSLFSVPMSNFGVTAVYPRSEDDLERIFNGNDESLEFMSSSVMMIKSLLHQIISRTIDSDAMSCMIVLSAPSWLHDCLKSCISALPYEFHPEILDRF